MPTNDLRPKLDALLSRYRGRPARPTPREVEELYADGCAEMLRLEAELLRLKRRVIAAEADSVHDPVAAREAADLQRLREQIGDELVAARTLVRLLRTALDWARAAAPSEPRPASQGGLPLAAASDPRSAA